METQNNADLNKSNLTFVENNPPAPVTAQPVTPNIPVNPPAEKISIAPVVEPKIAINQSTQNSVSPNVQFVGFWKRVAILQVDTILSPLFLVNIILYFTKGRTIGDYVLQTKLVSKKDAKKPFAGQLIGRYFAKILSALGLHIGFFCVGWRTEKNAWHDSLSGTRYIETKNYHGIITWIVNLFFFFGLPYITYSLPIVQNNIQPIIESAMNLSGFFEEDIQAEISNMTKKTEISDENMDLSTKNSVKYIGNGGKMYNGGIPQEILDIMDEQDKAKEKETPEETFIVPAENQKPIIEEEEEEEEINNKPEPIKSSIFDSSKNDSKPEATGVRRISR